MSESNTKNKKILIVDYDNFKIIYNSMLEEEQKKINEAFKNFEKMFKPVSVGCNIKPTGILIDELKNSFNNLSRIDLEKPEKHFEKFNYKMKRGKKKWR